MYHCEITSDQLENRLKQMEDDIAGARSAVAALQAAGAPPAPRGSDTQCYVNWAAGHQALSVGAHVAREELLDVLDKILKLRHFYYVIQKGEVDSLVRALSSHRVTKHGRFPAHGVHVDIKHEHIYMELLKIREVFSNSGQLAVCGVFEGLEKNVRSLRSLLSKEIGEDTENILHERDTFEAAHGLVWG